MDFKHRFVTQLIENPAYFQENAPKAQETVMDHWDKAFPLLVTIGIIVLLLVGYRICRPYFNKIFSTKFFKRPRR